MYYAKHPELGNKHFESVDRAAMEADGWVFWPHESGLPDYLPTEQKDEPEKRKPGRPKKVSPV